jgi:hypothetical protein
MVRLLLSNDPAVCDEEDLQTRFGTVALRKRGGAGLLTMFQEMFG